MPDSKSNNGSSTPSEVHFHGGVMASPSDGDGGAASGSSGGANGVGNIAGDHPAASAPSREVVTNKDNEEEKDESKANGIGGGEAIELAPVNHVRIVLPSSDDHELVDDEKTQQQRTRVARAESSGDVLIDMADGKARGTTHKAKSVSHWHDSRISVEMHLALYIEDLMMLAPGAGGDVKPGVPEAPAAGGAEHSTAQSSAVGSTTRGADVPVVEFDEDAEPDITLQHVLAGVEYLLQTRIIGGAQPNPEDGQIAEGNEEDEDENPLEKKQPEDNMTPAETNGLPAPLANAPPALVSAGISSTASAAAIKPASNRVQSSQSYFYFVALDLNLCDDLVTALCFHMRRAERAWSLRPKPSAEAMKALHLFHDFFRYVYSFRCCVAARPASYLRASLKVGRHMRTSDPLHRKLVVRVLLELTRECPRIERWEDLVDADDQQKVREMLTLTEFKKLQKQLAGSNKADREQSISRQTSFRTSLNSTKDGKDVSHGGDGSHAMLQQSFPAFYSTRHHRLLPPKGALYDVEPKRLLAMFCTNAERGLDPEEIKERQEMYGLNSLPPPVKPTWLQMIWGQLKDFIILVLIAASVVSMATEDWKAAGVLLFVVLINVIIGLVQEHRSAKALEALNSFSVPQATVVRGGEVTVLPASELVPGDIVQLDEGVNIPADLRLIDVSQLATIEAILTGESLPIVKSTAAIKKLGGSGRRFLPVGDRVNMAFMSTLVSKGRATAIVVNTGATTEVGRIYSALNASSEGDQLTPLQKKLATLGKWLVLIALLSCALVVGIGLGRGYGEDIIHIGISLAVSVIPEGLVTVVTLTMAVGVTRMAQRKAIVRNLPAVETLGAVTTICSDKTGTLTEGKMKTECMWVVSEGAPAPIAGAKAGGYTMKFVTAGKTAAAPVPLNATEAAAALGTPAPSSVDPAVAIPVSAAPVAGSVTAMLHDVHPVSSASALPVPLQWHTLVGALNNNACIKVEDVIDAEGKVLKQEEIMVGDATEVALLRASQQAGASVEYWQRTYGLKRVMEFAFDSDRKRMSVILELPADEGKGSFLGVARPAGASHILLSKGAPEAVLTRSVSHITPPPAAGAGTPYAISDLSDPVEDRIEEQGSIMASQGMRVLATAFRFLTKAQTDKFQADQIAATKDDEAAASGAGESLADQSCSSAESDLVFIGLTGIMDPPRTEVPLAIARAHRAGIRVCMITGDHFDTALAIAKQIGIYSDARGDRAMNGDALAVLSEEQLAALTPFPVVFSRVSPENKLKLVKSLQRRGEVTAMTGDGVNDSPAIKAADVGVAMGLGGTEVTRQAADIVLSDDDFSTIVEAVEEGRRILDNIVKFLVYLLSCNGAEVAIMLIAVCAGWEVPYLPLMILWANIFVDIPPSLALGLEKVDPLAMDRQPRATNAPILLPHVLVVMAYDAAVMALIVLLNYWHMLHVRELELSYARSFAFILLAIIHLLHAWVSSSLTGTIFRRDLISNNPSMLWAIIVSVIFVVGGHYVPGLNDVLELDPIYGHEWGILFWNLGVFLAAVELRKLAMRVWEARHKHTANTIVSGQPLHEATKTEITVEAAQEAAAEHVPLPIAQV